MLIWYSIGFDFIDSEFSPERGSSPMCFDLTPVDDAVVEDTERLFVSLTTNDPSASVQTGAGQFTVITNDNDGKSY